MGSESQLESAVTFLCPGTLVKCVGARSATARPGPTVSDNPYVGVVVRNELCLIITRVRSHDGNEVLVFSHSGLLGWVRVGSFEVVFVVT